MTPLGEQEVGDLLGAYTLGALSDADMKRVQEHLMGCDRHANLAADLARVTPALALAVEDRAPSPELRQRILAAIRPAEPTRPVMSRAPEAARAAAVPPYVRRRRVRPRSYALAAAAAVVLLAAGVAFGRLTAPQAPPPAPSQVTTLTFQGNAHAPNVVARIVYFSNEHRALVEITGLQPLSSGRVYEMWLFKGASPQDAGVAQAPTGTLVAPLRDLAGYSQFAVTVEPAEVPQPTTAPILAGKL